MFRWSALGSLHLTEVLIVLRVAIALAKSGNRGAANMRCPLTLILPDADSTKNTLTCGNSVTVQ